MGDIKYNGSFYAGDKPDGKFIALYEDGSGGALFMKIDGQNGRDVYMAADSCDEVEYDWFFDAGYSIWVHVPAEHTLWCERNK